MRGALALVLALWSAQAAAQLPARWVRAPLTEVARAQVHAEIAWERYGLSGRGAVLCLIDTGVDARHPALSGAGGASRVRWLLDSFAAPRGRFASLEARFGGAVWRGDEPDLPGDPHGHGTAMASIAIGDDGDDSVGPRAGLAPAASLIVVRAYDAERGGFPDEAVVNGVRFCRAVADAPMVVLLSLGGHDGAHDGQGGFERALDELARSQPIVVAAGNDGARAVRATGRLFAGERTHVGVQVPRSERTDAELALTVRADAPFTIAGPDGEQTHAWSGPGEAALNGARVRVEPVEGEPDTLRVVLSARDGALASGTYRVELAGPARFEVWLAGARLGPTFFAPALLGPHVRADEAITIPATAEALIAVGATISRRDVAGVSIDGAVGARAAFSSIGPAPSGAPKPDLVAPGGWILAALSGDVRDGDPDNLVGGSLARYRQDGRIAVRGTSAAAAVVAGALLLALELDPSRATEARALLTASARGELAWTPGTGAGLLDIGRLLASWSEPARTSAERGSVVATRPLAIGDDTLWLVARGLDGSEPAGERLTIAFSGRTFAVPLEHGAARAMLPTPPLVLGAPLRVQAAIDGVALAPLTVPVVLERSDRGAVTPAGGCATAPTHAASPPWLSSFALVLVSARAARRGRRSR